MSDRKGFFQRLGPEARIVLRHVGAQPRLFLLMVLSLGLGIGFATTLFSFLHALFLASPTARNPDEVVVVYGLDDANPGFVPISHPNVEDLGRSRAFAAHAAYQWAGINLESGDRPERLIGQIVTPGFFAVLEGALAAGRGFAPEDDTAVVLSHRSASRLFGDPAASLGTTVRLSKQRYVVVGVARRGFDGVGAMGVVADFWVPMAVYDRVSAVPQLKDNRGARMFGFVARLAAEREAAGVQQELDAVAARLRAEFPEENAGLGFSLRSLREARIDPGLRDRFVLSGKLLAALGFLLVLIATANVANLLMIETMRRRGDRAVRSALGARTIHQMVPMLIEGLLVALGGSILGVALSVGLTRIFWSFRPPFFDEAYLALDVDWTIAGFALLCTMLIGLAVAAVPLFDSVRKDLAANLQRSDHSVYGDSRTPRFLRLSLMLQVGIATVSLVAAGLFLGSLNRALAIDLGMAADRLLLLQYDLKGRGMDADAGRRFGRQVRERVEAIPGVVGATLAGFGPLTPFSLMRTFEAEGTTNPANEVRPLARINPVTPEYFATVGIPVLAGRGFRESDGPDADRVVLVNRTMARRSWPEGAIDRRLRLSDDDSWWRVVGVVADSKYGQLTEEAQPYVYLPLSQQFQERVTLLVRTETTPEPLLERVRNEVQALAPDMPLTGVQTLEQRMRDSLWLFRLAATTLAAVAAFCLLLAALGIYGALSFSVRARRREVAIRMALGGRPGHVVATVLRQTLRTVAAGAVVGLACAWAVLRLARSLLFDVQPTAPSAAAAAIILLGVAGLAASLPPLLRSIRVHPGEILRRE